MLLEIDEKLSEINLVLEVGAVLALVIEEAERREPLVVEKPGPICCRKPANIRCVVPDEDSTPFPKSRSEGGPRPWYLQLY